jgi:hypothetical protein
MRITVRNSHVLTSLPSISHAVDRSWRRIKVDFLKHFHKPRIDLLLWILVEKLAPTYHSKLDALEGNGRHCNRASWRKAMKREFRRCARAHLGCDAEDSLYVSDPHRWICTCPHFATSRFLVCKHLVQACEPIDPRFFWIVPARNRVAPFWRHPLLVPKGGHREPFTSLADTEKCSYKRACHGRGTEAGEDTDSDKEEDEEDEDDADDGDNKPDGPIDLMATYDDGYIEARHELLYLLAVLDHNAQFRDRRFLELVRARMSGASRLVNQLQEVQAHTDSTREDLRPSTWGRNGLVRFLGFRTLSRERARELQHQRTTERQGAGLA